MTILDMAYTMNSLSSFRPLSPRPFPNQTVQMTLKRFDLNNLLDRLAATSTVCYTNSRDYSRREMILDPRNAELRDINTVVMAATVTGKITNANPSWTDKMLSRGLCAILKKVNEEAVELVLAACRESSSSVILEAADLIYHVVLAMRPLKVSFESLMDVFRQQINTNAQISSLGALAKLATYQYNIIVARRNILLFRQCKVESVIAAIVNKLYSDLFYLTFLGVRSSRSSYVSSRKITDCVYSILISVLLILNYRNLSYQSVVDELYKRLNLKSIKQPAVGAAK
ncbi:MAG: phosphoribosyl-ATP diphosphatase [Candidatus Hodgkinia cicadicola]